MIYKKNKLQKCKYCGSPYLYLYDGIGLYECKTCFREQVLPDEAVLSEETLQKLSNIEEGKCSSCGIRPPRGSTGKCKPCYNREYYHEKKQKEKTKKEIKKRYKK